jgi:hypothetical protein
VSRKFHNILIFSPSGLKEKRTRIVQEEGMSEKIGEKLLEMRRCSSYQIETQGIYGVFHLEGLKPTKEFVR